MKVSPKGLEFLEKVKRKYFLGEWSICAEIVEWIHVFVSIFHSAICFYGDWWPIIDAQRDLEWGEF